MSKEFLHLHTHSHYSLLTATPKIDELVHTAKEAGMSALAITDNGNLYGAIEFYKECTSKGIKPIIGVDFYQAIRTRTDREPGIDNRRHRLVLLAKDEVGYKNLLKLVTLSNLEGFYYKPRIDKELMERYHEGLVCIIPSFSGETTFSLKMKDYDRAESVAKEFEIIFGKENTFLEITHHPEIEGSIELNEQIILLGKRTGISLVAAHDVYYLKPEDRRARETMIAIQNQQESNERIMGDTIEDFSFISSDQADEYFKDIPEAVTNTARIASMCNLELKLGTWNFPDLKIESGRSYDDELRHIVMEGLVRRNLETTKEVSERIEYELKVIKDKGYSPYFLVVGDLLRFAHENNILTSIRGSVAGSLITYLAGITNVNPIEYKLPFERFLNPERPSAPDIDMDFADNRRDEMIEYAREKYGRDKVAQIGTFGTMMARGSVRDVTRALGYPYSLGDRIAKLIPMGAQGFPMTIKQAIADTEELRGMYEQEAEVRDIIDLAKKIEGCARHISVHAAGVVISPTPLTDYTPLQFDTKGENKIITQYDMYSIDENNAGLLKFDFLGIKNLSILAEAVKLVKTIEDIDVDIENVPVDDKKTFELLAKGETMGLFQLNGEGMTKYLKELKPSSIHDINAMVALYRPGPLEMIPEYIARKHNPELIKYIDPRLKEILSQSYGVITYQDDVMLTAIKLGGYSWLEADKLRKAMGKKIPEEMEAQKGKLLEGLVKNGLSDRKANQLWKLIEPFAAYGFNKAHAASYGKVAYQTAYMKANFPAIYMASVLTADSGDVEKIAEVVHECTRMGIEVLPPDINESFASFTVLRDDQNPGKKKIRFGLYTIKNFGAGIGDVITLERKNGGRFTSITNFLDRIIDKNLNKKSLDALIKCGAMDAFGERGRLVGNIEEMLAYNKEKGRGPVNQDSLFGIAGTSSFNTELTLRAVEPASAPEKLGWEKELLGLYVSGHPLDRIREKLEKAQISIKKVKEEITAGKEAMIAGIIEDCKAVITKKGDKMAFLRVADFTDKIEVVVFPKTWFEFKSLLELDKCIAVKGKISDRNGELSMIADAIRAL
jgi:DNA polymerase-3 subunit alpha